MAVCCRMILFFPPSIDHLMQKIYREHSRPHVIFWSLFLMLHGPCMSKFWQFVYTIDIADYKKYHWQEFRRNLRTIVYIVEYIGKWLLCDWGLPLDTEGGDNSLYSSNPRRVGYIVPIHGPLDGPLYMGSIYSNRYYLLTSSYFVYTGPWAT